MNVGSSDRPVSATATAGAAGPARDASATSPTAAADAAGLFLGVLNQVTAVPEVAAAAVVSVAQGGAASTTADTELDDAALDWALPFLQLPQGTAPRPLDLELPPPGADGVGVLPTGPASADDATLKPLPTLLDDFLAARNSAAVEGGKAAAPVDATGPVALAAAPRVETTATGNVLAVIRHVPVPVSDGRWPAHIGHEVRILVERGVQGATLRLTPEHLGPVDVRIDVVNDKTHVVFNASHADTRAALTEAIPRLREMFAGAGLSLGQADVREHAPGPFTAPAPRPAAHGAMAGGGDDEAAMAVATLRVGLVDAYA